MVLIQEIRAIQKTVSEFNSYISPTEQGLYAKRMNFSSDDQENLLIFSRMLNHFF